MAKKSKTQRARASARRKARKELRESGVEEVEVEEEKPGLGKRILVKTGLALEDDSAEKSHKEEKTERKSRFQFFKNVRAEMKRVTWPDRPEILRWTGVVIGALIFFTVFILLSDNLIVTPILLGLSSLGA